MRISDWSSDVCSSDLAWYIHSLEKQRYDSAGNEIDKVRLTDRFFLGEPQMRGFDIRGVGPRVIRYAATYDPLNPVIDTSNDNRGQIDDALGGRASYHGRIELDIPLGPGAKELGLRPSLFLEIGQASGRESGCHYVEIP